MQLRFQCLFFLYEVTNFQTVSIEISPAALICILEVHLGWWFHLGWWSTLIGALIGGCWFTLAGGSPWLVVQLGKWFTLVVASGVISPVPQVCINLSLLLD